MKTKIARLITQYRNIFSNIFPNARPSFFRVLQRMTSFKRYKSKIWEIRYNK